VMKELKHKPKKSLGQNFLKSEPALRKIIEVGEIKNTDTILEIGPGKGKLTEKLLEKSGKVIAVEKDGELFHFLQEKFKLQIESGTLHLLHEDILELEIAKLKIESYKIIANIPYNITGAILKKFLTEERQPERMVLMVQNEVAKRIVASDKKESILSISVKAYGKPKFIMKVPARYFSPAPKVDSAVILISEISRKTFQESGINEEKFWEIVKAGFSHKRKMLSGNLKSVVNVSGGAFLTYKDKRAEDLALKDWIDIVKM
jgi:16S rRNA (adenine1518-N6/adenine1519-N6)-dimethyltransferase